MANEEPRKKAFPTWILAIAAAMIVVGVLFVGVWQFLAPADRKAPVAFSDFVAEVQAGRVDEIRIRDREITFRVRGPDGRPMVKETIGPIPDEALVASLKPIDPNAPLPKIYFEK